MLHPSSSSSSSSSPSPSRSIRLFPLSLCLVFLLLCDYLPSAHAILIPVRSRPKNPIHNIGKRATNTSVHIVDEGNTEYLADITMGGAQFTVTIDTGSSDLWIDKNVPSAQTTSTNASVQYVVGSVEGPVSFVETSFAGVTVAKQAFILAVGSSSTTTGITDGDGLIGLGPSAGSNVRNAVGNPSGDPFLDNVFRQNTSTPNTVTILLQRVGDDVPTINGQFTISEIVPGMESIQSQPQVPVTTVKTSESLNQHWSTLIDAVYGPDGNLVPITSTVPGTPSGKFVVAYDTGFTFPQVPRPLSDAIYGRVQGAEYDQQDGFWIIPCDQELNVTFTIGGNNFTINPLDTSVPATSFGGKDPNQCVGAFQPIGFDSGNTIDGIMGMAFIRNVYMLINFGDFVDGNPSNQKAPFMQFLSTTSQSTAHKDFVDTRLNGQDITGESQFALLPASQGQTSTAPKETGVPDSSDPFNSQNIHKYLPYIIAGSVIIGLALLGFLFACCCRRRRGGGVQFSNPRAYRALQDPTPAGYNMYNMPPQQDPTGYYSQSRQGYGAYADPYYQQ